MRISQTSGAISQNLLVRSLNDTKKSTSFLEETVEESKSAIEKTVDELKAQVQKIKAKGQASTTRAAAKNIAKLIAMGVQVTPEVHKFLLENYPDLYREAIRISQERAMLEARLSQATTREEAERILAQAKIGASKRLDIMAEGGQEELANDLQEIYAGAFEAAWNNAATDKKDAMQLEAEEKLAKSNKDSTRRADEEEALALKKDEEEDEEKRSKKNMGVSLADAYVKFSKFSMNKASLSLSLKDSPAPTFSADTGVSVPGSTQASSATSAPASKAPSASPAVKVTLSHASTTVASSGTAGSATGKS